jgi:1-deoxy-D-xylulose-5-phosphate synthase
LLAQKSIPCDVYKLVKLYPFTDELLDEMTRYEVVLFAEECIARGGIGEHLEVALHNRGWEGTFVSCAIAGDKLPHATVSEMKTVLGLDAEHLVQKMEEVLR